MIEFKVSGMTCSGCVRSVTNAIKSFDSEAVVKVDLALQTIDVKSIKKLAELKMTIEEAGFPVLECKTNH